MKFQFKSTCECEMCFGPGHLPATSPAWFVSAPIVLPKTLLRHELQLRTMGGMIDLESEFRKSHPQFCFQHSRFEVLEGNDFGAMQRILELRQERMSEVYSPVEVQPPVPVEKNYQLLYAQDPTAGGLVPSNRQETPKAPPPTKEPPKDFYPTYTDSDAKGELERRFAVKDGQNGKIIVSAKVHLKLCELAAYAREAEALGARRRNSRALAYLRAIESLDRKD